MLCLLYQPAISFVTDSFNGHSNSVCITILVVMWFLFWICGCCRPSYSWGETTRRESIYAQTGSPVTLQRMEMSLLLFPAFSTVEHLNAALLLSNYFIVFTEFSSRSAVGW